MYKKNMVNSPYLDIFKGKEAWDAECKRWYALTAEQQEKELEEYYSNLRREWAKKDEERKNREKIEKEKKRLEDAKYTYIYTDSTTSLENSEATLIWIVVMAVGAIFEDRWVIWIFATLIWLRHIFRYRIREHKWENGGRERYFKSIDEVNNRNNKRGDR